jgi:DNA-binding MarR family transcriptional regulator
MSKLIFPENAPQVLAMIQRLIRLRRYFRMDSPENMRILGRRLHETFKSTGSEEIAEPGLFYNIGMVFSHHPDPITMGELSRELDVPLSSATRIMDWLVRNNYANRYPDANDRRIVRVGLTEEGLQVYAALNEIILESSQKILRLFSPEEISTMHQLLAKALDAIEKETGNQL